MGKRRQEDDDLLEFHVDRLIAETQDAWLLKVAEGEIWFPKSKCDFARGKPSLLGVSGTLFIPEWLAIEKGLV